MPARRRAPCDSTLAGEQFDRRERLHGLAETHVIAEDASAPAGEEQRAARLEIVERDRKELEVQRAGFELGQPFLFAGQHVGPFNLTIDEVHRVAEEGDLLGRGLHVANEVAVLPFPRPEPLGIEVGRGEFGELIGMTRRQVDANLKLFTVVEVNLRDA